MFPAFPCIVHRLASRNLNYFVDVYIGPHVAVVTRGTHRDTMANTSQHSSVADNTEGRQQESQAHRERERERVREIEEEGTRKAFGTCGTEQQKLSILPRPCSFVWLFAVC